MTVQTVARQKIIALLDELPSDTWPEVADFMEFLRLKLNREPVASLHSEPELLSLIKQSLSPEEQARLHHLQERVGTSALTPTDQRELLLLAEKVERISAERASAMLELARLRSVPAAIIFNEFAPALLTDAN